MFAGHALHGIGKAVGSILASIAVEPDGRLA
jgi:hypothetical protein